MPYINVSTSAKIENKKNRSKNTLFNPYKNGISAYDMAYLSSKKILKNKTFNLENDSKKDNLAA